MVFLFWIVMAQFAKLAWILILIIFFVGEKILIIFGVGIAAMLILNWINPKWFDP